MTTDADKRAIVEAIIQFIEECAEEERAEYDSLADYLLALAARVRDEFLA